VTAHDGFTLHDLVSYEHKHNDANGEDNRDGADENVSRNWGTEGPTDNPGIAAIRERMKRNFLATLVFSQGVRMLVAGDELGRTQQGNNNAYCQDNELSWVRWDLDRERRDLLAFARHCLRIFQENAVLRRRSFFKGRRLSADGVKDVTWLRADGAEMTEADWGNADERVLGMLLPGRATDEVNERGRPVFGDTLLLVLNGGSRSRLFQLPRLDGAGMWEEIVNTARPIGTRLIRRRGVNLVSHSVILLRYLEDAERLAGAGRETPPPTPAP
jgi:glycogen operon protein